MFTFVKLSRFVGEKIGFELLVFGPDGPDIEPGRCTFFQYFGFPNCLLVLESPDFKISKSFRHFRLTRATSLFGDFELQ